MTSPLFITSIAPKGSQSIQHAAITSWLTLGGDVISANTPDEIASLSVLFPNVRFHAVRRDARLTAQKPVPFIDDLLGIAGKVLKTDTDPFIIINSDIILQKQDHTLKNILRSVQNNSLVCGVRLDVDDATQPIIEQGEHALGYDYFALTPALASSLPRTKLALGMPFWDYWLPLAALLAGATLVEEASDFALHSRHETRWTHAKFFYFSAFLNAILDQYTPLYGGGSERDRLAETMIRHDHSQLAEKVRSPSCTDYDLQALSDFYDRQFAVFVNHIRTSLTPLERS